MIRRAEPISILGAGLTGLLLAQQLGQHGHRVRIYESSSRQKPQAAAHVAAAMLAPLAESAISHHRITQMGFYSMARWEEIIASLSHSVFFQKTGTLILWHPQDQSESKRFCSQLNETLKEDPSIAPYQKLDRAGIEKLEPSVSSKLLEGLYLPDEGQLDNRQLLKALEEEVIQQGHEISWDTPKDLTEFADSEWVFDCRGIGAKSSWTEVRGVRGEVIRLFAPEVSLSRPVRLLHPKYPIYIAPKEDHQFVIGATEIESEDLSPMSVRSSMELMSAAFTVDSGFAEARIVESSVGLRPTLTDHDPGIRQIGRCHFQLNGLYRHGFLIAPAVIDAAIDWANNGEPVLANHHHIRTYTHYASVSQ